MTLPEYIATAQALLQTGRLAQTEAVLLEAVRLFPEDFYLATELAWVAHHKRDWAVSIARWRGILARFPDRLESYLGLGDVLAAAWSIGDRKEEYIPQARAVFEDAAGRFGGDPRLPPAYADALTRLQDWPAAFAAWQKLMTDFPESPSAFTAFGRALRDAGELQASADHLQAARAQFPDDAEISLQLALTLSAQRNWPAALAVWAGLKRRDPQHPAIAPHLKDVLWKARQDQGLADGMRGFDIPEILNDFGAGAVTALLMRFESIGSNCEFGLVQRRHNAEPLGLLRWAAISPDDLVTALDTGFAGVGDPEHTVIYEHNGEYMTEDRRYYMLSHTFTATAAEPMERFAPLQCRRIQFLRRKLLADLAAAAKIFVYKAQDGITEAQMLALYAAMQRHGPGICLVCVRLAADGQQPGTVQRVRDRLFCGYLDQFSNLDPSIAHWIRLCQSVADHADLRD
jgi:hypothetical protein